MSDKNSFRDSLRVDSETMAKLDNVSKNYSSKKVSPQKRKTPVEEKEEMKVLDVRGVNQGINLEIIPEPTQ